MSEVRARRRWRSALQPTAQLPKRRTLLAHRRVEDSLALLDPALTVHRLGAVLVRLYGFWYANEPPVDTWARAGSTVARRLGWSRRRRVDLLRDDLRALGLPAEAPPTPRPLFAAVDDAAALGWAYVAEGSALGGAVIARRLLPLTAALDTPLRFFTPYEEGPQRPWRAYLAVLQDWVGGDAQRGQRVLVAAGSTFDALDAWVAPLRAGTSPPTAAPVSQPDGCSG